MENQIIRAGGALETSGAIRETDFSALAARFAAYLDASPKTVETYSRALKQFFKFLWLNNITMPTREDVLAFRNGLTASGHKPTTVQNYITAVKLFFAWTAQEGFYPNIADHIKGARLSREHKKDYLTSEQIKDILSRVERDTLQGLRDYAILTLMVTGGLRTIEVIRANVEDIGTVGNNAVLYVQGKGRDERSEYVKLMYPVENAIRAYLRARGFTKAAAPLFTSMSNNNRGGRLTTRAVSGMVKARFINAGYESARLTAHSLRHSAVTLSLLAGKDITEVQQFARHTNIATTLIYDHAIALEKNGCGEAIAAAIF